MRNRTRRQSVSMVWLLASAMVVAPAALAPAAVQVKHAGTVDVVDQATGTMVIEDVGPRLKSGESPIRRVRVKVGPSTQFTLAQRTAGAGPEGWIGAYTETPLSTWQVKKGDYAVVTVEREKAVKVTVVDPREP